MNKIVGQDVCNSYPDISERFIINTDTIKMHLKRVISSKWESISFYSHKLTPAQ